MGLRGLRIRPAAADSAHAQGLASGTLQPIRFHFASDEPVFPLEISSLNPGGSTILLYVWTRDGVVPRSDRIHWTSTVHGGFPETWLDLGPFVKGVLGVLTKHRATLQPAEMRDVYFQPYDPRAGSGAVGRRHFR